MVLFLKFYNVHLSNKYKKWNHIVPAAHRNIARANFNNNSTHIDKIDSLGYQRVRVDISHCNKLKFTVVINAIVITYQVGDMGYHYLLEEFKERK